ncbi:histidinol-phosphate transaminase [Peribacillus saganii]|uniref:Histidinol-phosphate aminotransferase n=1 Tax=Peribacillus saganii TaxID=2303992 RepID=A0A372LNJ5_9BACI|nr:histidinol-phosphate transaminase [Peribacillus saganii]RFU68492.1 histidinol-phosphate transaminase [Peribacillus saganii]
MKWKEAVTKLQPYQPGKSIEEVKRQYGLTSITKLASNENPFGCSNLVREAISGYGTSYALYPDGYATNLRAAVAEHVGKKETEIIFGNGSDEIIQIISRSLLYPGRNTVMAAPTFPQYKHNAVIEGADSREVPLIDGEHDLSGMLAAIDNETSVVWLCSPNNPTGIHIPAAELVGFLSKVPKDVLVVLDEAYYEYTDAEDFPDSVKLLDSYENLIILRTFSKIYGLAAFRVGYGIAHEEIIRKLEPAREPFNTNTLGQIAAIAALADQGFISRCKEENKMGLQQYYSFCEAEGLAYYPSQGNFILINFDMDSDEVFQYLLENGYIVRSGRALGFPGWVRVTIGSHEQNEGIIAQMKSLLAMRSKKQIEI